MNFFNIMFDFGRGLMLLFLSMILISFMATVSLAETQDHRFGINSLNGNLASPIVVNPSDPVGLDHTLYIIRHPGFRGLLSASFIHKTDTLNNPRLVLNQKEVVLYTFSKPRVG